MSKADLEGERERGQRLGGERGRASEHSCVSAGGRDTKELTALITMGH